MANSTALLMKKQCVGPYLLLVSHGALPSHHNLASCFCLQLFGRQTAGAQDPPYKVKLHKRSRKAQIENKQTWMNTRCITSFTNRRFYNMCVFTRVCVCLNLRCVCVSWRDQNRSLYGSWLVPMAWQSTTVLLTLSVTKTEWLTRQLPLFLSLCVCVCFFNSVALSLSHTPLKTICPLLKPSFI